MRACDSIVSWTGLAHYIIHGPCVTCCLSRLVLLALHKHVSPKRWIDIGLAERDEI